MQRTLRKLPGNVEPGFLPSSESSAPSDEPLGESETSNKHIVTGHGIAIKERDTSICLL